MALKDMALTDYINKPYRCSCGKTHMADIGEIIIENGALAKLPDVLSRVKLNGGEPLDKNRHGVFMLADENTYAAAGKQAEDLIVGSGYKLHKLILKGAVVPNETTIFDVLYAIGADDNLLVAAGSGTINDICRFLSFKVNRPYISVATAPSMDGFASIVSPVVIRNMKISPPSTTPRAIIGDTGILKKAPAHMIAAGLGDILGKYNALCDWKISSIVTGEDYCPEIASMVESATKKCEESAAGLAGRDEASIALLMEALTLTGIAMCFWRLSRPASSAEHHIAHFWEMSLMFENREPALHGAKVGVASVAAAFLHKKLSGYKIDFEKALSAAETFDYDKWRENARREFKNGADDIINQEISARINAPENRTGRIRALEAHWPEVVGIINNYTPSVARLKELLTLARGPVSPPQINVSRETALRGLLYAKDARVIYSVLQVLNDLSLLGEFADECLEMMFE